MSSPVRHRIRIAQTRARIERLHHRIETWRSRRTTEDARGQYKTQLGALSAALQQALEVIRQRGDEVTERDSAGRVYGHCRRVDQARLDVDHLFSYFRERIDQRDDPELGPVLRAADEVVWSLWAQVWRQRGRGAVPPAPLAYLEPHFSPQAIPRDKPPRELAGFGKLAQELRNLPMPLVTLPPACVREPWWLIFLGHEIGHHLQYDLVERRGLIFSFRDLLAATARAAGGAAAERAESWYDWGIEIFADAFSVLQHGPWATWSLFDLVMGEERSLLRSATQYPSPVVRLAWMAAFFRVSIGDGEPSRDGSSAWELRGLDPESLTRVSPSAAVSRELRERARADLGLVPAMARTVAEAPLPEVGTLRSLCRFEPAHFVAGGRVERWKQALLAGRPPSPVRKLEAARQAVTGGLAAWAEISADEDDVRRGERQEQLREILVPTLGASFEPGVRAAETLRSAAAPDESGQSLGERLWAESLREE